MYGWAGFDRPDGALRPSYNRAASHRFLAKPESSILNRTVTLMSAIRTARFSKIIGFPPPLSHLDYNYLLLEFFLIIYSGILNLVIVRYKIFVFLV